MPEVQNIKFTGDSPLFLELSRSKTMLGIATSCMTDKYFHFYFPTSGYHLDPSVCRLNGTSHLFDALDQKTVCDIQSGKCLLILDISNEGHIDPYSNFFKNNLREIVSRLKLPGKSVLLVDQNRLITIPDECPSDFNELRDYIEFANYDYQIKRLAVELELKNNPFPSFEDFVACKEHTYLCMIGTPRPAKLALYYQLLRMVATGNSLLSYFGLNNMKCDHGRSGIVADLLSSKLFRVFTPFQIEGCEDKVLDAVEKLPLCTLDIQPSTDLNSIVTSLPYELFRKSHFSLVVETDYSETGNMRRITEKTFKAFACGHPSIIFGNPGSIKIAKSLGFDVFDDIILSSYDSILDPLCRLDCLVAEVGRLLAWLEGDRLGFLKLIYERCKANYEYAHSGAFLRAYEAVYDERIKTAMSLFCQESI